MMNTQRWLALVIVGGIVALIVTRPLWLPADGEAEDTEEAETAERTAPRPAPRATAILEDDTEVALPQAPPTADAMDEMEMMDEEMMEEDAASSGSTAPFILARGDFVQLDAIHGGDGSATVYQAPDGTLFVRLEPFSVTDAPDLRVALSSHPAPRTQDDLQTTGGFLDLGPLQSNQGAQNYDIPLTVRLEQFQSVVVYDRQFNIIFTTATLER
jgi:hypothetical protein